MTSARPFVRLLLPLVAGILGSTWINDRHWFFSAHQIYYLVGILGICLMGLVLVGRKGYLTSPIIFAALFCLGLLTATLKFDTFQNQVVQVGERNYDAYLLEIRSLGEKRKTTIRYEAQVISLREEGVWRAADARVIVSLADQKRFLEPGTRIVVQGPLLQRPHLPRNPDEFDYQKYLERKGVAWTVYLSEDTYSVVHGDSPKGVGTWPLRFSAWADSVLRTTLGTQSSYGLVKAMVLARREDLGADLLNAYIQAGAVHVLAVSGLHVGILFWLLSLMLNGLRKSTWGRFGYMTLILVFLTFYALITGLSPSVVRASLMCVMFALSQTFSRRHDGVNTLAVSAFIILIFDPMALFSVGFQLSYAAVLGILLFYPLVREAATSRVPAVHWLIQITLVSLSAQVFTFPLSIYYFHQFPAYFWLVNPVVIGLTPVLIYSTLILLSISWIGILPLTQLLAYWMDGVARGMNGIVELPKLLPNYLFEGLTFDLIEVSVLFMIMLVLYKLLRSRESTYLRPLFISCLLFFTYSMAQTLNAFTTSEVFFHYVPKHTVVSVKEGQKAYILSDAAFSTDTLAYNFYLKNYFVTHGISSVSYHSLPDNATIEPLRVNLNASPIYFDAKVPVNENNWLIIRQKQFPRMSSLPHYLHTQFLVSPELGFKTKAQWLKLLEQSGNQVTDPANAGAVRVP
jgi:competence protein ComEC